MSPTQASRRFELFGEHWGGRREREAGAKRLVGVQNLSEAPSAVTCYLVFGFVGLLASQLRGRRVRSRCNCRGQGPGSSLVNA